MKDGRIENSVQTVANLAFLVQDWLYTEKFLSSALTLPIVLDMIVQKSDLDERREKAIRTFKAVRIIFYIILATWFATSMILISFTVRMAQSIIFCFLSVVFCWSVLTLKKLIKERSVQVTQVLNFPLLYLNLFAFIWLCICTSLLFVFCFLTDERRSLEAKCKA